MDCTPEDLRNYVIFQIGALQAFCNAHGTQMQHVKPHGALYLTAVENEDVARAVAFFLAPENSFVTGQTLFVCGGASIGSLAL
jgi:lactam utilization protein B